MVREMTDIDARVQRLLDESDIRALMYQYCRGIDRRQMDLVRACYHPDAFDHHGTFAGDLDGFIAHAERGLDSYESTMHFIGNLAIEVDGDTARTESYCVAFHRLPARGSQPADRDHVVALRYVDDLVRYEGSWRIMKRACVFDWTRTDTVKPGWTFSEEFLRGRRDRQDVVFTGLPRPE